ncbi:exodeoxyribonuclease VII large subunit [Candidatus Saccharibacteria bacterium]|nr:exodeoxyribonuclease VII large subunit [Candidatus Saccharibacteria bacterium]
MDQLGAQDSYSVSEFLSVVNQTLDYAYPSVSVKGEVASFKVNQGKWVFFDLKDEESSVPCFIPLFQLRMPIEDGMKVIVKGSPKVTKWGKFSFTVKQIQPVGEGSIKKSFELLKKKLEKEGLFDPAKKRGIPSPLKKIGVISSTGAAGYADFCKILNARWGGLEVYTAHVQVQGMDAPDQIIRALKYFNEKAEVDIIAIIRGGGSADDLSVFNDEKLAREIAASRIPVITGIGHEVDESLADLVADIRASTPSNVAEMLTPDRKAEISKIRGQIWTLSKKVAQEIDFRSTQVKRRVFDVRRTIDVKIAAAMSELNIKKRTLDGMNPEMVLKQGYAILSGEIKVGEALKITTIENEIEADITKVSKRKGIK